MPLNIDGMSTDQNSISQSKPIIRSQYTNNPTDYEKNNGISNTIPDDTLSIPEILKRFVKGQPIYATSRKPYYDSENDFETIPDLPRMDLTEQADYFEQHAQNLKDLRKKFTDDVEEKRMADLKAKLKKEFEAEEKERRASFINSNSNNSSLIGTQNPS